MEDRSITKQNKLIIAGLLSSTFLIVGIGIFATFNIQDNLKDSYQNYSEIIAQTIADSSVDVRNNMRAGELKNFLQTVIKGSDNILAVKYVDADGKVIVNEENPEIKPRSGKTFTVVTPRKYYENGVLKTDGSLTVVFSANVLDKTSSTIRLSIFSVFALAWLIFASVILISFNR